MKFSYYDPLANNNTIRYIKIDYKNQKGFPFSKNYDVKYWMKYMSKEAYKENELAEEILLDEDYVERTITYDDSTTRFSASSFVVPQLDYINSIITLRQVDYTENKEFNGYYHTDADFVPEKCTVVDYKIDYSTYTDGYCKIKVNIYGPEGSSTDPLYKDVEGKLELIKE